MKKIWFLSAIAIVMISFAACTKETDLKEEEKTQIITQTGEISLNHNKMLEDLDFLCKNLEKKHKNLYANISKEEFEIEKQKLVEKISDSMTEEEFYYELKHLLSFIKDAHTNIEFQDSKYKYLHALGFAIEKFDADWYLLMLEEKNQQYLGYQLIAINDINIEEIYKRAKTIISFENEAKVEAQFSNTINFAEALEYLEVIEENSEIVLSVRRDENSEIEKFSILPMTEDEIMSADILTKQPEKMPETTPKGIYRSMQLNETSYYIQYNSCQEAEDLSMKDFVKFTEEEISKKNYQAIIVDLRYNSGGNSSIFEPMIKKLKELKKEYGFEVYTLIGKSTFSSAILNAIQLKKETDCIFVGSPTGGNVNHYGDLKNFNLPNFPITVWYSTKYFEMEQGYEKDSLYPDIMVVHTWEDYINGIDREIETIISSIICSYPVARIHYNIANDYLEKLGELLEEAQETLIGESVNAQKGGVA